MDAPPQTSGVRRLLAGLASPRPALIACLALMWVSFGLTGRWAHVVGALHGPKRPLYVALLAAATVAACLPWRKADPGRVAGVARLAQWAGVALLAVSFFQWFPLDTWTQLPFLDNWATRFQTTVDALTLYLKGVGVGWQWHFLGGYHSSSDISQTLSTIGALPMLAFGERVGFHLVHLLVLMAIPALVYVDHSLEGGPKERRALATGLVALTVTGWFSYYMTRSGDTNSMAGAFCALAALTGSHAAAVGRRWGAPLLVGALALMGHSHTAYLVFTAGLLALECVFYRDGRRAARAAVAVACGVAAALPLTWESWRHPAYFNVSNVDHPSPPFVVAEFLRKLYYNVEIHFLPGRWFNDFTGLQRVMAPALLWMAWKDRSRSGFYAWATFAVVGLMLLNAPVFGYAFLRPIHLLAVLPAAALAGFLVRLAAPRLVVAALVALVAVYVQISWMTVPHIDARRDLDPVLVDRVSSLDGAMVLLENTFHRDLDGDPNRVTERTPFSTHFEAYLAAETGKRFYAGLWDGWQWSVFRTNLLSGGAFRGALISTWPPDQVRAELRRWGVRHLLVWSRPSTEYFSTHDGFARRWTHGLWTGFELMDADTREVVVEPGTGSLADRHALGADVRLTGVTAGGLVVVRTNHYPAWRARLGDADVPLFDHEGQLAFRAPLDGTYTVQLVYPRRYWLNAVAVAALLLAMWVCLRL